MFGVFEEVYIQEFKVGLLLISNDLVVFLFIFVNIWKNFKIIVINLNVQEYVEFNLKNMKDVEDVIKKLWNLVGYIIGVVQDEVRR